jgi:hypothetical protein
MYIILSMGVTEKIVIKTVNRPDGKDIEALSGWFCKVFDLSNGRSAIEPLILQEIANTSLKGDGTTSKMLNKKLSVPRSTVIYHLNRFIYSGLVIRRGRKYFLRSNDMVSTLEDLQGEILREFSRLIEFAEKMDEIIEGGIDE